MCTRASVMASLPVSPAKSPLSASATAFTPPGTPSGFFCSQAMDSGHPCGRPAQHGTVTPIGAPGTSAVVAKAPLSTLSGCSPS